MKKYLLIVVATLSIVPSIAFASWWNPFTWFKQSVQTTQLVSPTDQTAVEQLSKKIDTKSSVQTQNQKVAPKVIQSEPKQSNISVQSPKAGKLTNKEIIDKVKPAIVYISTSDGSGSGMIISTDGYVLTNAHVVSDQSTVTVTLSTGSTFDGVIVGRDEKIDLAILKVTGYSLPVVEFGNSDLVEQGDDVFTLGYPFGLKGDVSFKEGTISRKIISEDGVYLETSAEIHPGNSGGPLVDINGKVMGINTASLGQKVKGVQVGETIKFAIPINIAKNLIPELIAGRQVILPKTVTPTTGNPFQAEDSNMKVAKCQAEKQQSYNVALQAFDETMHNKLTELNNQRNARIAEISTEEEQKKVQCGNIQIVDYVKDSSEVRICYSSASTNKWNLINAEILRFNQVERNYSDARVKLKDNPLFDQIYTACLNR